MTDGREVNVDFKTSGNHTEVTVSFDPESENSIQMQKDGWQTMLDNFKKYTESNLP